MAGDWIPMKTDLWDSPQVVRILSAICPQSVRDASERVRKKSEIIGALYRTWSLFDTYSDDGTLHGYDQMSLDEMVGIEGWSENLQHVGWLIINSDSLEMPGFERYLSHSAKRRQKDQRRKADDRKNLSANRPQSVRNDVDKKRTTEEKRREEKNNKNPPNPPRGKSLSVKDLEIPDHLDTDMGRQAISDWIDYRVEIKKPIKTVRSLTSMFKRFDSDSALTDAVCYSISNGYQGLFDGDNRNGKPKNPDVPF